jgi:N-acetyl sugar amidotransferase
MMTALQPHTPPVFRVCTRTVMDTTDPAITFDADGVSHYWHAFQRFADALPNADQRRVQLAAKVAEISKAGRGKRYDCIVGLSGGIDSSYLAWLARQLGLRPLAVHFDNGWNSEQAISNIEQIVTRLGLDLETWVMDWDEFRDLQRAYFKASVLDLEVPTDHMILGALYKTAARHGIRHVLSGTNYATEWLLPAAWNYHKFDLTNLKSIHRAYGERPLRRLPALGAFQQAWYAKTHGITTAALLDLADYRYGAAKALLQNEMGWRDYGGKHHESVFTRFYQGYLLPRKFGIDKRKAHLSNLILVGETTRDAALKDLQNPPYDEHMQAQDKTYVAKKLGFSAAEFEQVLTQPNRQHAEFGTDARERALMARAIETVKSIGGRRKAALPGAGRG